MDRVTDATVDAHSDEPERDCAQQRTAFIDEAQQIENRHQSWAYWQRTQSAFWRRWNTVLMVTAAGLATASGGAGLASEEYRVLAAVAALVSAVLAAIANAFGASARSTESFDAAVRNQVLADCARSFRTSIAPFDPLRDARKKFDELIELRNATTSSSHLSLGRRALHRFRKSEPLVSHAKVSTTKGSTRR